MIVSSTHFECAKLSWTFESAIFSAVPVFWSSARQDSRNLLGLDHANFPVLLGKEPKWVYTGAKTRKETREACKDVNVPFILKHS